MGFEELPADRIHAVKKNQEDQEADDEHLGQIDPKGWVDKAFGRVRPNLGYWILPPSKWHQLAQIERLKPKLVELSYSYRNATSGSTCVALRAGKKHAANPTPTTSATTAPNVSGSVGDTPQIWLVRNRVSPKLANSPMPIPTASRINPFRSTIRNIWPV